MLLREQNATEADRLFAFVELTSLLFNLHGMRSFVFNLHGVTSHVLVLCTHFSKLNIAGLRCFSDLSTQLKCQKVKYMGKLVRNIIILTSLVFPLHPSFAEHSVRFCLINLLNTDTRSATLLDRVDTDPFLSFKVYLKRQILESYKNVCTIVNCHVCRRLKINDL